MLIDGRPVDVGERTQVRGEELKALAAVRADRELWQVVPDYGSRYREGAVRLPVHDERVRDTSVVSLGCGQGPTRRFFTSDPRH